LLKDVIESGIINTIVSIAEAKDMAKLKNLAGGKKKRVTGVDKLDDANWAGGPKSQECVLILTEGDSAKSLADSGIETLSRDKYGSFPLKGKMLNVRDCGADQIKKNPEIQNILKITGLKIGTVYTDTRSLRYGCIMVMADQDNDGSHIKGLLLNFLHHFWPSLIEMNTFFKEFVTPIIKATKGQEQHSFFTLYEFKEWEAEQGKE
jgi:DNA topoisomerase-2